MIAVTVDDVLSHVIDEKEFGIDKKALFAAALEAVPNAQQETFLSGASLGITLGVHFWEKTILPLSDDARQIVMKELGKFIPHRVVLLKETAGDRVLPIWIGPFEADLIALKLANKESLRPLTADLTKTLLDLSGTHITQAAVSKLSDGVFYGTLTVNVGHETAEIDCRPSDALVLAVRMEVSVVVAPAVMDAQGVPTAHFTREADGSYRIRHETMPDRQWKSMIM